MPCASGPAPAAATVWVALRTNLRAVLTVSYRPLPHTSLPPVLQLGRCLEVPCCPLSSALSSNTVHCLTKCRHDDAVHPNHAHWPPPPGPSHCSGKTVEIAWHRQIGQSCKPQPSSGSECTSAVPGIRRDETANRPNLPLPSWSRGPGRWLPYSS